MALFAIILSSLFSFNIAVVGILLLASSFFMIGKEASTWMALQREIWTKDIVDNLFHNNEFIKRSIDDSPFVVLGKIVHRAVAGAASGTTKNLNAFPAAVARRADTDQTYELDTYRTNPTHVLNIEKYELAYDKRQSVLGEDENALIDACVQGLLYRWAPLVANTVLTTGADAPSGLIAGQNRKSFTRAEIDRIKLIMDAGKISPKNRVAALTAYHMNQFMASLSDAERTDVGRVMDLKEGIVGRYMGFDLYMRASLVRYRGADGAYVVVDEQDNAFAADNDDRAGSLIYQQDSVSRAIGETIMFGDEGKPEYYGDIYSFEQRMGGRIRRPSGIYSVVDALAA